VACGVLEGYGLSETSPVASFNHPDRPRKPGSIGTPIRGVQMRVVDKEGNEVPPGDVGEIAIRGHNVMKGYWHRPEDTAKATPDGWFRTGDMGRVDADGYYAPTSSLRSRRISTRGWCGSRTNCPRVRLARSSNGRSFLRQART